MTDITYDATKIRPEDGSRVRRHVASGSGLENGEAVLLNLSGQVDEHGGDSSKSIGLLVANDRKETDTVAQGDGVAVVTFGPVSGFTGLSTTPGLGRLVYLSANAGKLADSGSVPFGYVESDTVLFVAPGIANMAS